MKFGLAGRITETGELVQQQFFKAEDSEIRRQLREQHRMKEKDMVENPWRRFTNDVPKYVKKSEAKEIKRSQAYKTAYRQSIDVEAGGGGGYGDLSDPFGRYKSKPSTGGGLSMGDIVGKLGTPEAPKGTGATVDYAPSVGDIKDIDTGDIMAGTTTSKAIQETFERLSFKTPMMRDFSARTMETVGSQVDVGNLSQKFSEQFGNIGSYEQFQESLGQYGIDTISEADLSRMSSTEAQDYIDKMAEQGVQSFEAFEKASIVENLRDLEKMQQAQLGRITETYDPATASFDERMEFNSAVRSLQQVGMGTEFSEDIRAGDYAKLATGAVSALMGNPMGLASLGVNLKNMASTDYTAMGQLAKYGRLTDPSLKGVDLSNQQLDKLGRMTQDIQDFSKTVRTAEQNREFDRMIQNYVDERDAMVNRISAQVEGQERLDEVKDSQKGDDQQAQGGTELSNTAKAGLIFNRDVSNKGLGDVISVFGQITTEEEEERRVRELGARRRLGLAGLWGV